MPVVFQQDVHSFLLGEHWTGALKGIKNAAAITFGTGLGFGMMREGNIVDNGKGGPFQSIFNLPYGKGILEDRISHLGLISQYREYSSCTEYGIDVKEIARRARKNQDQHALKVFKETGYILAEEISRILKEYVIGNIVFGGQISLAFDLFGQSFKERLSEMGFQINVMPGENILLSAILGVSRVFFTDKIA